MVLGSGIRDPGSEIRDPEKTYSGSPIPGSKSTQSRIRIRNTATKPKSACIRLHIYDRIRISPLWFRSHSDGFMKHFLSIWPSLAKFFTIINRRKKHSLMKVFEKFKIVSPSRRSMPGSWSALNRKSVSVSISKMALWGSHLSLHHRMDGIHMMLCLCSPLLTCVFPAGPRVCARHMRLASYRLCAGILEQSVGVRYRLGIELSRTARLNSLAKSIPRNRFLGPLKF